jgi:protein SCO1/2
MSTSRWARAAASALLLAAASCGSDEPDTLAGIVREPPLQVADVELPSAADDGALAALVAPAGELRLVYFGYTSCPDICPTTMSDLSVALQDLPDDLAARVTVAMTTVDPERDTDEVLVDYLDHFFDHALALRTEDPVQLQEAADAFGVEFELAEHRVGEAYDVAHTAMTYVVDDTGTVVVEWPFGFETDDMTSDLTILLRRDPS